MKVSVAASSRSIFSGAGHSAVWVSLYVGGCTVCLSDLSGSGPNLWAVAAATLLALSLYILDRVKLSDARLDPADRLAHPERFRFISRHGRALRLLAVAAGVAAMAIAAMLHSMALVACLAAYAGVLLYAGGGAPHRPRIKDRLLVKNAYVAVGITALCVILVVFSGPVRLRDLAFGAGALLLIVMGDSILCDVPDAESDARFGTHTVVNSLGPGAAWAAALICDGAALLVVLIGLGTAEVSVGPVRGLLWPAAVLVSTPLLMIPRPAALRDLVDARLGLLGVLSLVFF